MKKKKTAIGIVLVCIILVCIVFGVIYRTFYSEEPEMLLSIHGISSEKFICTGEDVSSEVEESLAPGQLDSPYIGVIESSVSSSEVPVEDMQSNFGYVGAEVVFNRSGVAVEMDGKWIQFDEA